MSKQYEVVFATGTVTCYGFKPIGGRTHENTWLPPATTREQAEQIVAILNGEDLSDPRPVNTTP